MEDSMKGLLITMTTIGLFITAILSYITIFPQEQGITYETLRDNETYLSMSNSNLNNTYYLDTIENRTDSSFDEWDITEGFMGTNTIKQGSKSGVSDYNTNIFATLSLMADKLFGTNSPIVYAIGILSVLSGSIIIYMIIKFVRTGN